MVHSLSRSLLFSVNLAALLLVLVGCSHSDVVVSASPERPLDALVDASPFEKSAELFDGYVHGKLTPAQIDQWKDSCHSSPENPFCYSLKHRTALDDVINRRNKVHPAMEIHPLVPIIPQLAQGKLKNMRELRKGTVPAILKGLLPASLENLETYAVFALKEKRCPNNFAIAIAASMEDYLASAISPEKIAELYLRGARCSHNDPQDLEHYLTRAGLLYILKKDFARAAPILSKVTESNAFSGRALYWLARAKQELGDKEGAQKAYDKLLGRHHFSFHAVLTALQNNVDPGLPALDRKSDFVKRSSHASSVNPLIEQAEILRQLRYDESAAVIADWALDHPQLETPVKLYIAQLGDSHAEVVNVPDILIHHPDFIARNTLELAYPKAYFSFFDQYSNGINPFLLLSVARQESTFKANAISPANAQGLLQLNPETSQRLSGGKSVNLLDPQTNIALGSLYLNELLGKFKLYQALAAYNAGEEPVGRWIQRYATNDPILWIDLIPYRETRDYVGSVLSYYFWYRRIYDNVVPKDVLP